MIRILIVAVLIIILNTGTVQAGDEISVDLVTGAQWIGFPGIVYDHNNNKIESASDLAAYIDYTELPVDTIVWYDPCLNSNQAYSKIIPGFWVGPDFLIYPGQGMEIQVNTNCTMILDVECISNNHTICDNVYFDIIIENESCQTLEELLMEFGETLILLMLLYLNHTSKNKNLLLVTASVTYVTYLTVYVNVNEHIALIGFYILLIAYFVLSILPGGKK